MILDGTTFTNTTSDNMIVIDENGPNTGIGIRTLANLTTVPQTQPVVRIL
jgi:hypothetical protein